MGEKIVIKLDMTLNTVENMEKIIKELKRIENENEVTFQTQFNLISSAVNFL